MELSGKKASRVRAYFLDNIENAGDGKAYCEWLLATAMKIKIEISAASPQKD
jgi:hypothetical protein